MHISGFQRLSLIDYPGVISSIVFTQGCPFRCVYCHNPELIPTTKNRQPLPPSIPESSILAYLDTHARMIEGVVITGGEPTIHPDLPDFIRTIKKRRMLVKLDTNGVNPTMVEQLIRERLIDYIAMDLKHVWSRYREVVGKIPEAAIDNCRHTFSLLQASDIAHEFRITVYPGVHRVDDIMNIANELRPHTRYALQEIHYHKTYLPDLVRHPSLGLEQMAEQLHLIHPTLELIIR